MPCQKLFKIVLTLLLTAVSIYNAKAEVKEEIGTIVVQGEQNVKNNELAQKSNEAKSEQIPVEIDQDLIGDVNNNDVKNDNKENSKIEDNGANIATNEDVVKKQNIVVKQKNQKVSDTLKQYGDDFLDNININKKSSKIKKKVKFEVSIVDLKDTKTGVATKNLQEAYKCYKNKDYEMAIYYYQKSLQENSKSVEAQFGLGVSYQLLHQYDQAIQTYLSMLSKNYSRKKLISNLLLCLRHKTYQDALDILLSIDSKILGYSDVLSQIGIIYMRINDNIKAISAFTKAHELNPTDPIIAYNLGILYDKDKNIDYAKHFFELAVKNDIGDILTHEEAQELDLKMKELDEKIMKDLTNKRK